MISRVYKIQNELGKQIKSTFGYIELYNQVLDAFSFFNVSSLEWLLENLRWKSTSIYLKKLEIDKALNKTISNKEDWMDLALLICQF